MRGGEEGQAVVELALCIPFLVALLLFFAQVGSIVLIQEAVTVAAREAARTAAVDFTPEAGVTAAKAATRLDPERMHVQIRRSGETVTADVTYASDVTIPFSAVVLIRPELSSQVTMYSEVGSPSGQSDLADR